MGIRSFFRRVFGKRTEAPPPPVAEAVEAAAAAPKATLPHAAEAVEAAAPLQQEIRAILNQIRKFDERFDRIEKSLTDISERIDGLSGNIGKVLEVAFSARFKDMVHQSWGLNLDIIPENRVFTFKKSGPALAKFGNIFNSHMSYKRQIWALFGFQFRSLHKYCNKYSESLEANLFSFVDLPGDQEGYPELLSPGEESSGVALGKYFPKHKAKCLIIGEVCSSFISFNPHFLTLETFRSAIPQIPTPRTEDVISDEEIRERIADDMKIRKDEIGKNGSFLAKMCQLERDLTFFFIYYGDKVPEVPMAAINFPKTKEEAQRMFVHFQDHPPKIPDLPPIEARAGLLFSSMIGNHAEAIEILDLLFVENPRNPGLKMLQSSFPILRDLYRSKTHDRDGNETTMFKIMS